MKSLLLGVFACILFTTGFASPNVENSSAVEETAATINFRVAVNSAGSQVSGVTVVVIQNGVNVSSGISTRGICYVSVPATGKFTLQVLANGYKEFNKEYASVTENELISIMLIPDKKPKEVGKP